MKVSVVRSGGFAGLTSNWEVIVDDQDDPDSWIKLIESLPWQTTPRERQLPDGFNYRISCSRHRITLPEHQVTGSWRELVDRVRKAAD
ncbi:MAG: protealysin inhibitor emfourin [Lacisediminihabitans sp.]